MEYHPLDTDQNEIRLLTILPFDGNDLVCCTLEHASLINSLAYSALSYCWGDPTLTKPILVNNTEVQVTRNLESALRHLRAKGYREMWVDAVCINQKDDIERSQQLLWMGAIYRRATEVEAWAGDADGASDKAINVIRGDQSDGTNEDVVNSVVKFLERPYWRRIWIIQELALATRIMIHCGDRDISWSTFVSWHHRGRPIRTSLKSHQADNVLSHAQENTRNLIRFQTDAEANEPIRLLNGLKRTFDSLSSDPRDKIFALLGLVYDSARYIPTPNYRQSVRDICIAMTLSAVSNTGFSVVPLLCCGLQTKSGLPTWTINWFGLQKDSSLRQLNYILGGSQRGYTVTATTKKGNYQSAGQTKPVYSLHEGAFRVKGTLIDEIDALFSKDSELKTSSYTSPAASAVVTSAYNCYTDFSVAIGRALTRVEYPDRYSSDSWAPDGFEEFLNTCWGGGYRKYGLYHGLLPGRLGDWLLAAGSLPIEGVTLQKRVESRPLADLRPAVARLAMQSRAGPQQPMYRSADQASTGNQPKEMMASVACTFDEGMSLMSTRRGYIGWAHPQAEPGDNICIIGGCEVPAIIRERSCGGYSIVGDAYVEGFMYGEAIEGLDQSSWKDFVIH